MRDFDVLVLGSGPGGQKAAIAAAKLGRKVGLVERRNMIGGVCVNTGTIPSKTLREAVLYLTGFSLRDLYGASYRIKAEITIGNPVPDQGRAHLCGWGRDRLPHAGGHQHGSGQAGRIPRIR